MNDSTYGQNNLPSSPSVCSHEPLTSSVKCNAGKGIPLQKIALLVNQSLTTSVVEPCLSPLLWSESFRMRLHG